MTGKMLAEAAESFVGARFRLHGRDPATGLDCIGVLAAALAACGLPGRLPNGYRLRAHRLTALTEIAADCGFVVVSGEVLAGDVFLVRTSPCQFHLVIGADAGAFIHADAGLRRVVRKAGPIKWPIVQHWRLGITS